MLAHRAKVNMSVFLHRSYLLNALDDKEQKLLQKGAYRIAAVIVGLCRGCLISLAS